MSIRCGICGEVFPNAFWRCACQRDPQTPDERIAQLRQENEALKAEVARLRKFDAGRDVMARVLQSWIDYRAAEGPVTDDTCIMSPPKWPSIGMLKAWIEAIRPLEQPTD